MISLICFSIIFRHDLPQKGANSLYIYPSACIIFMQAAGPQKQRAVMENRRVTCHSTQAATDRESHNARQTEIFNKKTRDFTAPLPEDIKQASKSICPPFLAQQAHLRTIQPLMLTLVRCRGWRR